MCELPIAALLMMRFGLNMETGKREMRGLWFWVSVVYVVVPNPKSLQGSAQMKRFIAVGGVGKSFAACTTI